jgi:hypothetical protein
MSQTESVQAAVPHQGSKPTCCATSQQHRQPEAEDHGRHADRSHHGPGHAVSSLNRTAFMATVHCLTGCSIGEVLGMVVGTALGWSNWPTVGLAVILAFLFGYGMTLWPLRRAGMAWSAALGLAFASDTLSMTTMEIVDNVIMLLLPGAMEAGLSDPLFWESLVLSLVLAGGAAFPVNRWLISRGQGHALVHAQHCH